METELSAITQWHQRIDQVTEEVQTLLTAMPRENRYIRPATGGWNIAQILRHIMQLNDSYEPSLKRIRDDDNPLPWTGRIGWLVRKVGDLLLDSVKPSNRRKSRTFPIWEPPSDMKPEEDVLEEFVAHQEVLKQRMSEHAVYLGKNVRLSSPANKYLVYTLDKAFELIVTHEERHLLQLRERCEAFG